MPRLRNSLTGVVVRVDDATATRLGANWKPVTATEPEPARVELPASNRPRGNASRKEWAAHADALGVTYPEDATRNEIKAILAAQD